MSPKLLNIKDKKIISKNRFCPPHWWPHTFPWKKKITTESCHIHKRKWRMFHHKLFCKFLKCPNYKFMVNKSKK
ncbi:MAG: hypothetical protein V1788_02670 [Nanoarchaeota archaeon]